MEYTYTRIDPASPSLPLLAQKYRTLRLAALEQSPGSFSSTHAIESSFPAEWWATRLRLPDRQTFICVAHDPATATNNPTIPSSSTNTDTKAADSAMLDGEWVAQVTLIGPVPAASYALPAEAGQPPVAPDGEEEKWQMLSLYTFPAHRGKRVARNLCLAAFDWLQTRERKGGEGAKRVRVRIMVKPDPEEAVLRLYTGLGFEHAGRCTRAEGLVANGDGALVPEGGGGEGYQTRGGLIMTAGLERE